MKMISKEQVFMLHNMLIKETGGTAGLRDENLLESALLSPFATFNNEIPYPTLESKAARLAFGIIKNHPFVDGSN